MKHKNLKDLYNLHKETKWNAEALRLAIEVIFQRDYYEDFPFLWLFHIHLNIH